MKCTAISIKCHVNRHTGGLEIIRAIRMDILNVNRHTGGLEMLREPLTKLLKIVQLHLFGAINDNITFDFRPLAQMSELDKANIRKAECDIDVAYLQNGVVSDVEVRTKLAANAESGFNGIDVDDVPEQSNDDFASALGDEADDPLPAQDADGEWDESKHPRAQ